MPRISSAAHLCAALTVIGCLALSACGGNSNSASGTSASAGTGTSASAKEAVGSPASASGGATFSGTITVTGSVSASGSWTDGNEAWSGSCHDWAATSRAGAGPLNVPGPGGPMNAAVAGHQVGIAFLLPGYTGPGTYTSGVANAGVSADGHVYGPPSSYTLVVKADGSGSLTFSRAADPLNGSSVISGSETWTCH